jgi:hypothetical protein
MKKKTARLVKKLDGFTGEAILYHCTPPMENKFPYVVVSATRAMFSGPETYIFPGNKDGEVTDWGELNGSYHGGLSHAEALRRSGYSIV